MPNRILKESIRTSRSVNAMSDFQFRVWTYLITYVDDYGRGSADPELLKGFLFPRRRTVSEEDIARVLAELADMGRLLLYEVDGEAYLCFPHWGDHQRIQQKRSKFPAPPAVPPWVTVGHGDPPPESNPIRIQSESVSESESCAVPCVQDPATGTAAESGRCPAEVDKREPVDTAGRAATGAAPEAAARNKAPAEEMGKERSAGVVAVGSAEAGAKSGAAVTGDTAAGVAGSAAEAGAVAEADAVTPAVRMMAGAAGAGAKSGAAVAEKAASAGVARGETMPAGAAAVGAASAGAAPAETMWAAAPGDVAGRAGAAAVGSAAAEKAAGSVAQTVETMGSAAPGTGQALRTAGDAAAGVGSVEGDGWGERAQEGFRLPLRGGSAYSVRLSQIAAWAGAYPAVDVRQELRRMKSWLDANPSRRKSKSGILRFATGWLAREQEKHRARSPAGPLVLENSSLDLEEYERWVRGFVPVYHKKNHQD